MLEPPPPASGYTPNLQNSEPSQPDLSSDNNLGNTPENQLEREEAEKREVENIAENYMGANYVGTNTPAESPRSNSSLEGGSKDSSPDQSKPEEQKPTAPENTLFVMPDGKWYIDDKGRSYLSEFIKKTQEKKVDVKSPEELEEELKKLELSKKKKKLEELTGKINTAKTQTPRLFEELGNEIEKLKTQIEKEKETFSEALKKEAVISNIITQIEDPEIYKKFPKDKDDPIEGIITKILAEDPKIDDKSKKIFGDDVASIAKIIAPIVKENAIKEIITQIEAETPKGSQSEEDEFDSFRKIINKILEKDSLISKYYKKNPYPIIEIIYQIKSKETDGKADENRIEEIITQIQTENKIAFQVLTEDPLVQILIEHKKETSDKISSAIKEEKLSQKDEDKKGSAEITRVKVKGKTNVLDLNRSQENIDATFLALEQDEIPKTETETTKPSLFSKFFSRNTTPQYKKNENIPAPDNLNLRSDVVFFEPQQNPATPTEEDIKKSVIKKQYIALERKEKKIADQVKEGERGDQIEEQQAFVKKRKKLDTRSRLLLYAQLIDKIPEQYSESISSIHQEIINLKKQEKEHEKTLDSLTKLIAEEEEQRRIAEEEGKKRIVEELAEELAREVAIEVAIEVAREAEEERIAQEAIEEKKRIENARPSIIKPKEEKRALQEKIREIQGKLNENSKTREEIEGSIKEILSPEYVDKNLRDGPKESIMDQLIVEAIIVNEAKELLGPDGIKETEFEILQQSSDKITLEAFNLLIIRKSLEIKFQAEGLNIEQSECDFKTIYTQINIDNFFNAKNKLFNYYNKDQILEDESKALKDQLYNLEIKLSTLEASSKEASDEAQLDKKPEISAITQEGEVSAESDLQTTEPLEAEEEEPLVLISQDKKNPRLGTTPVFTQASAGVNDNEGNSIFQAGEQESDSAFNSDELLGEILPNPESQLGSGIENTNESSDDGRLVYEPFSGQLIFISNSAAPPLASYPPAPTEEVSSNPLTKASAISLLREMLEERKVNENPYQNNYQQNSGGLEDDENNFNQPQQLNEEQFNDYKQHRENNPFQPLEEKEEEKIKQSFTNLFIRCLIQGIESNQNKTHSINQIEDNQVDQFDAINLDTSNEKPNTPEEINFDIEELVECKDKISAHLVSEYQKLLNKLKPPTGPKKILGLQAGNDEDSPEHNQEELKKEDPIQIQDPIIYCGVGIRMKLETEIIDGEEEYYLEIVDIFHDSALDDEKHMNKKISEVKIKKLDNSYEYQSITSIFEECNDIDKFYAKISSIFHNPSEEKIGLKFKDEKSLGGEYTKKIFRPQERSSIKLENIMDVNNSLNSIRPKSTQLTNTSEQQTL